MTATPTPAHWQHALGLLARAGELDLDERKSLLVDTQSKHPEVAGLLARLLDADVRLQDQTFLDAWPTLLADCGMKPPDASSSGELVGPFVLLSHLGTGGMGTVWRARYSDERLNREVAIKRPHLTHLSAGHVQEVGKRLARERAARST